MIAARDMWSSGVPLPIETHCVICTRLHSLLHFQFIQKLFAVLSSSGLIGSFTKHITETKIEREIVIPFSHAHQIIIIVVLRDFQICIARMDTQIGVILIFLTRRHTKNLFSIYFLNFDWIDQIVKWVAMTLFDKQFSWESNSFPH